MEWEKMETFKKEKQDKECMCLNWGMRIDGRLCWVVWGKSQSFPDLHLGDEILHPPLPPYLPLLKLSNGLASLLKEMKILLPWFNMIWPLPFSLMSFHIILPHYSTSATLAYLFSPHTTFAFNSDHWYLLFLMSWMLFRKFFPWLAFPCLSFLSLHVIFSGVFPDKTIES